MKYLMVTKWDNVFTQLGDFTTNYPYTYIEKNLIENVSGNIPTIFINTKYRKIWEGILIKINSIDNQKIYFDAKIDNELNYNNIQEIKSNGWYSLSDTDYDRYKGKIISGNVTISENVYITKANSARISNKIDKSKLENLKRDIYKSKIYMFNKNEEMKLLAIQEFFDNPEKFIKEFYNEVQNKDTFRYVWEGIAPAYHTNINCEKLNNEYLNYEIPTEIRERGIAEVRKFRQWFNENRYLLEKPDVFVFRLQAAFKVQTNPNAIRIGNSGPKAHHNLTIEQIEAKIDELLEQVFIYEISEEKIKNIIKAFGKIAFISKDKKSFNNHTLYSDDEIYSVLDEYQDTYKKPIYDWLIEYYMAKLNPKLQFPGKLLDEIGFHKCRACDLI